MAQAFLLVFIGGGAGSMLRYALALGLPKGAAGTFPLATLAANTAGCLLIGLLLATLERRGAGAPALLFVTGFCGGFTTFSTFSADTLRLMRDGAHAAAFFYMALTLAGGLLCSAAGYAAGKVLAKLL